MKTTLFTPRVHYQDLSVHIGMHDRLGSSHPILYATNGVKHPSFTSNAVRDVNDIAVLTLGKKIKFSDIVRPICLPSEGEISKAKQMKYFFLLS